MTGSDEVELRVGELAERTGLSVRALHHYDEIGLLSPARRTAAGHRIYGARELRLLQQIASLRQLGFSLDDIRDCLDRPEYALDHVLEMHISGLEESIEAQRRLRRRLGELAERLRSAEVISVDELLRTIEETTMFEDYYSTEQLQYLADRKTEVGEERIQAVQTEWTELFSGFETEMTEGAEPTSEGVQKLARRAAGLIAEFTGGDQGVAGSLGRMVGDNRESMYRMWGISPEVGEYMGKAMAALREGGGE